MKSLHVSFLVVFFLATATAVMAEERLTIKAPAESAQVLLKPQQGYAGMWIDGWACNSDAGPRSVGYVYRLKLMESGFNAANRSVQQAYGNAKKAVKAPATFTGLSTAQVTQAISTARTGATASLESLNYEYTFKFQRDLSGPLKEDAEIFFNAPTKARELFTNSESDLHRTASDDDGAHQVWSANDCYSAAELKALQGAISNALSAAATAHDALKKTLSLVHDGQGSPFNFP